MTQTEAIGWVLHKEQLEPQEEEEGTQEAINQHVKFVTKLGILLLTTIYVLTGTLAFKISQIRRMKVHSIYLSSNFFHS